MSPQGDGFYSTPGTHTSVPNSDGSSNIYVHHISHGAPAQSAAPPPPQMPQMFGIPYPMPMPTPPPPPMYVPYPAYSCHPPPQPYGYYQQQQQPAVIVVSQQEERKEEKKKDEVKKVTPKPEAPKPAPPKPAPPKEEKKPPPKPKGPQQFSRFSIASVIMFFLGLVFGIFCVFKSYESFDSREAGVDTSDEDYIVNRTVAIGTGGASTLCFTIAILGAFYAGMRHKSKGDGGAHCCMGGFLIAGGVIFCLTCINELIILVLAFDSENVIYPEVVWSALIGNIISWMLMFGYSEMARRA
ncbi:hypothetical protein ACHAXA_010262 [Cyclostephanos tholiformis]|jgi:hypothetical protein|uniref:Uncharacterized protein n=1 Tax=Cyclostephanos tholiformis TaxID=382380 RepID=A0ABD3RTN9_9STRA